MIEGWNKVDLLDEDRQDAMRTRAGRDDTIFAVSAITGEGLDDLFTAIAASLDAERSEETVDLDFSQGKQRAWLFKEGVVEEETQDENGFHLRVKWTARQARKFETL
jgi:GTP-binding protein HflX